MKVKVKSLSHVQLFATPWTAAYQAPPSMGFSRQHYWSGYHCLLQLWVPAAAAKSLPSCPTLCDPIDASPPGSPIPRILQARTLEWVAISLKSNFSFDFMPSLWSVVLCYNVLAVHYCLMKIKWLKTKILIFSNNFLKFSNSFQSFFLTNHQCIMNNVLYFKECELGFQFKMAE